MSEPAPSPPVDAPPAEGAPAVPAKDEGKEEKAPTQPEVEEPQNALTKKFTEAEWKALKEFRVRFLYSVFRSLVRFWWLMWVITLL